jgi:hypothetical protein
VYGDPADAVVPQFALAGVDNGRHDDLEQGVEAAEPCSGRGSPLTLRIRRSWVWWVRR